MGGIHPSAQSLRERMRRFSRCLSSPYSLMHGAMPPATLYIWRLGPESRKSKLSPTPRRNSKFIGDPSSTQRVLQLWSNRTWSTWLHIGLMACFDLQNTLPAISHATYVPQTYISIVPTHMHRAKTSFSRHNAVKGPHGTHRRTRWAGCSGNTCPSRARSPLHLRAGAWCAASTTRARCCANRGRHCA